MYLCLRNFEPFDDNQYGSLQQWHYPFQPSGCVLRDPGVRVIDCLEVLPLRLDLGGLEFFKTSTNLNTNIVCILLKIRIQNTSLTINKLTAFLYGTIFQEKSFTITFCKPCKLFVNL